MIEANWARGGGRQPSLQQCRPQVSRFLRLHLKTLAILTYFQIWFFIYNKVNTFVCDPSRTIHLTSPYQLNPAFIQPSTAIIYVFGGIWMPAIPFFCRSSWSGIRFVLCCYTITSLP